MTFLLRQPVVVSVEEAAWIYEHPERCEHCHHLLIFTERGRDDDPYCMIPNCECWGENHGN